MGQYSHGVIHHPRYLTTESFDAGKRLRVGQITTLFDGKTLNADNPRLWSFVGTAEQTFANNYPTITADAEEYGVRQSRFICPYFSGKSQAVEMTCANFHPETKVIKRLGYFSSDTNSPYTGTLDGFFLESSAGTTYLVVMNAGTQILKVAKEDWNGDYEVIKRIDFSKFNVYLFDFLWLGGANLRLHMLVPGVGFVQLHSYQHAGQGEHTFIKSPNQPVRYEIRSSAGAVTAHMDAICSMVATEGSVSERGEALGIYDAAGVTCSVGGTIYALIGIKKSSTYRDNLIRLKSIGVVTDASTKVGRLLLLLNPTLSAPLTYAANSKILAAQATNQTVTAGTGRVLLMVPVAGASGAEAVAENILVDILTGITSTDYDELVLAYVPASNNHTVYGSISLIEYS